MYTSTPPTTHSYMRTPHSFTPLTNTRNTIARILDLLVGAEVIDVSLAHDALFVAIVEDKNEVFHLATCAHTMDEPLIGNRKDTARRAAQENSVNGQKVLTTNCSTTQNLH